MSDNKTESQGIATGAADLDLDKLREQFDAHFGEGSWAACERARAAPLPQIAQPEQIGQDERALPPLPECDVIAYTAIGENDAYSAIRLREYGQACARAALAHPSVLPAPVVAASVKPWQKRVNLDEYEPSRRDSVALHEAEKEIAELRAAASQAALADEQTMLHLSRELIAALKRLSFAAQTSGGTAGPDTELQGAIKQAGEALSLSAVARAVDAAESSAAPAIGQAAPAKPACQLPPLGWGCTRPSGHQGPCAAWPAEEIGEEIEEKHAGTNDQGHAQNKGDDAGAACAGGRVGTNQYHEHREVQSGADRRDGGENGGSAGLSNSGEVRAAVVCDLPPEGWYCTRSRGHSGPCAAYPASAHLVAPAQGAQVGGQWISVEDRMPEGRYCLAVYETPRGQQRIIRAMYVRQYEVEATGDECDSEYNEADDREYLKAGWLECIDNWGEYSSVYVTEGKVTHWMPLPATPGKQSHSTATEGANQKEGEA